MNKGDAALYMAVAMLLFDFAPRSGIRWLIYVPALILLCVGLLDFAALLHIT